MEGLGHGDRVGEAGRKWNGLGGAGEHRRPGDDEGERAPHGLDGLHREHASADRQQPAGELARAGSEVDDRAPRADPDAVGEDGDGLDRVIGPAALVRLGIALEALRRGLVDRQTFTPRRRRRRAGGGPEHGRASTP